MKKKINNIIFKINNRSCKYGTNIEIAKDTKIGVNCRIGRNSRLKKNVVIGNNVKIGDNSILRNTTIGENSKVESGVKVVGSLEGRIKVGSESYIGLNNVFDTSGNITIGDYVHIAGPSTALWCHSTAQMCVNAIPLKDNKGKYRDVGDIEIEHNTYIGGNCTIYPGVKIGHHSIIAPNSAVTKSFPPYSFIGGVPAIRRKEVEV